MSIENRNENLDIKLGIKSEIIEVKNENNSLIESNENKEIAISNDLNLENEIEESKSKLKVLFNESLDVFEQAKNVASDFSKPRDIEAFSGLIKNMGELQKQIMDINYNLIKIKKDAENKKDDDPTKVQNNFVFLGDMRKLNDIIDKN